MSEHPEGSESARTFAVAGELRVLVGKLKRRLREEANLGDFTLSQISVLSHLERDGPATVTTLARAEGVRPQSLGATVAVLEAAGLVSGTPDPKDGRQTILSLTAVCRERIQAARSAREDLLFQAIQANLTAEEQEQLAAGIDLLKRLVD